MASVAMAALHTAMPTLAARARSELTARSSITSHGMSMSVLSPRVSIPTLRKSVMVLPGLGVSFAREGRGRRAVAVAAQAASVAGNQQAEEEEEEDVIDVVGEDTRVPITVITGFLGSGKVSQCLLGRMWMELGC
jgi:hypothetical protein